ncbi:4'-phosphopantetheinyl transferase superfamily protein [Kitasatospora sp. NPDC093558]|uniref:4'-phosphopantetheinyl transferase family protein n=1 Tax=Kitasatospora sp. NPDC093558 TaxID=3155201 RepID=UPI00343C7DB9
MTTAVVAPGPAPQPAGPDPDSDIDLAAVAKLFTPAVVAARAHTEELAFEQLPGPTRELLGGYAAELRRQTFTAGRLAAARATAAIAGRPHWLDADDRGAPRWPDGTRGSLSHTNQLALAVAAVDQGDELGIDIEPLATGPGLLDALRYVCTPAERARVAAAPVPELAVLRVFCTKEALYKAAPPEVQRGLTMQSVELDWTDPPGGDLDPQAQPLTLRAVKGPVAGRTALCAVIGTHMVAAVTLPREPIHSTPTQDQDGQ